MILYCKDTGIIIKTVIPDQPIEIYLFHYTKLEKDKIGVIYDNDDLDIKNKIVRNKDIDDMSKQEIEEIQRYRRILAEDERTLNQLKPSIEEIKKAEQTVEMLSLLQEVL